MKLVPQSAPYIRKNVSVKRMMLDVIIALMPITLFAMIVNGWNGIYVMLISILTMLTVEIVAHGIIKWPKGMKIKELFGLCALVMLLRHIACPASAERLEKALNAASARLRMTGEPGGNTAKDFGDAVIEELA